MIFVSEIPTRQEVAHRLDKLQRSIDQIEHRPLFADEVYARDAIRGMSGETTLDLVLARQDLVRDGLLKPQN